MFVADDGVMDVAADYSIGTVPPRLGGQRLFEGADIIHGVLDLQLRPLRKRPIGHAEPAPTEVDEAIHLDCEIVGLVAKMSEPARVLHYEIEDIAVNHEIAPSVDTDMDGIFHDVDARLRPVPGGLQRAAVDDIADEIDGIGIMAAEKVQQSFGLRAACSEVDIGYKQSAKASFRTLFTHSVTSHARAASRLP